MAHGRAETAKGNPMTTIAAKALGGMELTDHEMHQAQRVWRNLVEDHSDRDDCEGRALRGGGRGGWGNCSCKEARAIRILSAMLPTGATGSTG